jgi:hypothetical protein
MLKEAVDETIAALDASGVAAEVAAVRMLAAALDEAPGDTDLWREFRFALKALREVTGGSDFDDSVNDLLARLGGTGLRDRENSRP